MRTISEVISKCKEENRLALIPYLVGGYPNERSFAEIFGTVCEFADIIEIGIPFSDPLADGPVIQKASAFALKKDMDAEKILNSIELSYTTNDRPPVVLMAYYNTIYKYGLGQFAGLCKDHSVSGTIIPDLPVEEAGDWIKTSRQHNLDTIFLVAPNSSPGRRQLVANESTGFIYCISVTGVTGARETIPKDIKTYLSDLRKITCKPLALGFGISTGKQIKELSPYCDAVIVGSALVERISHDLPLEANLKNVKTFLRDLKKATV